MQQNIQDYNPKTVREKRIKMKKGIFIKIFFVLLMALTVINTAQMYSFGQIVSKVDEKNGGVIDELGGFREDIKTFGADMNEIRSFLLLPTKEYSFNQEAEDEAKESSDGGTENTNKTELALYQYINRYASDEKTLRNEKIAEKNLETLFNEFNTAEIKTELSDADLRLGKFETNAEIAIFKINDPAQKAVFAIAIDKKTGKANILSILGAVSLADEEDQKKQEDQTNQNELTSWTEEEIEKLKEKILTYIANTKDTVQSISKEIEEQKSNIQNIVKNKDIATILQKKEISLKTEAVEDNTGFHYSFTNKEGKDLFSVDLMREDAGIVLNGQKYEDEDQLIEDLEKALEAVDVSTDLEKLVQQRKAEIETTFKDEAFQELLKLNSLSIESSPREEYNKLLYDVKNSDGKVQFSFAIELSSGLVKILKDDQEFDLESLLDDGSKKKP